MSQLLLISTALIKIRILIKKINNINILTSVIIKTKSGGNNYMSKKLLMPSLMILVILFNMACEHVDETKNTASTRYQAYPTYTVLPAYQLYNGKLVIREALTEKSENLQQLYGTETANYVLYQKPVDNAGNFLYNSEMLIQKISGPFVIDYYNGVHLISSKGNSYYLPCYIGHSGHYTGMLKYISNGHEVSESYGKNGTNALKLSDIIEALDKEIPEQSCDIRISFIYSASAGSDYEKPVLSVIDTADSEIVVPFINSVASFMFSSCNISILKGDDVYGELQLNNYSGIDKLYLYLTPGDWGASVLIYNIRFINKTDS